MGKITTKKRILFSFRGQVTINGQIMSEKPGIFCAQNGQKLWVFGQPEGGGAGAVCADRGVCQPQVPAGGAGRAAGLYTLQDGVRAGRTAEAGEKRDRAVPVQAEGGRAAAHGV